MNPKIVIRAVAQYFGMAACVLVGRSRVRAATYPRKIACHLVRAHCYLSFDTIGKLFGNRDHSTIIYYVSDIRDRVKNRKDESLVHLERLEAILYEWQKTQGSEPVASGDEVGEEVVGNGLGG
jgi:chromosomal replication initiation ATPase DnaA